MDHSGQKVCIIGEIQTMLRVCYAPKSFNDSPQNPQRIVKPQNVEGSGLLKKPQIVLVIRDRARLRTRATNTNNGKSRALPLSLFEQTAMDFCRRIKAELDRSHL